MNRRSWVVSIAVVVAVVVGIGTWVALGARPNLGLDLQGGISAIYSPVLDEDRGGDFGEILDQTIEVIRARVDSLGVAEPDISRQGTDVLVQLPGLGQEDVERAQEIIGQTAKLTFRPVIAAIPSGTPQYEQLPPCGSVVDDPEVDSPGDLSTDRPTDGPTGETSEEPTGEASVEPTGEISPTDVEASVQGEVTLVAQPSPSPSPSPDDSPSPSEAPSPEPSPTPSEIPTFPSIEGTPIQGTAPDDATVVLCEAAPEGLEGVAGFEPTKYLLGSAVVELEDDRQVVLDGSHIEDAFPQLSGVGGFWEVALELDGPGGDAFAEITSRLACERDQGLSGSLAIVLDDAVHSAPAMNPTIICGQGLTGGQASISVGGSNVNESLDNARDLALVLRTGALPVTLVPSTFETVSPTLGSDSLRTGLIAGLVGLALVGVWLILFYRWLGVVALSALSIFAIVMYGLIAALGNVGFALTLAGVAGVIVSIGITADSSVLFFERLRDEVVLGKTTRTAIQRAYKSAFRTNLAGNTVTLAAAAILYFLAIGPVRGFALTLGLSTVLDIIILWTWSRPVVSLLGNTRVLTRDAVLQMRAPWARRRAFEGEAS